jgi:hypothetical protein
MTSPSSLSCDFGACGGWNGFYQGPGDFNTSWSRAQKLQWLTLAIHLANHTGVSDKVFECEVTNLEDPSLNPSAVNPRGGGFGAVGLMQVRQVSLHEANRLLDPAYEDYAGPYNEADLLNPVINLQVGLLNFGSHLRANGGNVWAAVRSAGDGTNNYVARVRACAGQ